MTHHTLDSDPLRWLLVVGLVTALICAPFFRVVVGLGDEGAFLRAAELMLRGKRLYADFFEFIPPGTYLLTAAWFSIAGISIESARMLAMLTAIGIACFTFLACRLSSRNAPLSAALACIWAMMSQWHWMQVSHHWFATLFSIVAAWSGLASLEQGELRSLRWPAIAGAAAGAATTALQTCGALNALAAVTPFINSSRSRAELMVYMSSIALIFGGLVALLAAQHTLAAAFNDIILFAASQYTSIQSLPFGYGASLFDWPLKYLFPLAALLLLFVIAKNFGTALRDRPLKVCTAFALAGFCGCFPRPDIAHIGFTSPLTMPLIALCMTKLTHRLSPGYRSAIALSAAAICLPSILSFAYLARTAIRAPIISTARGKAVFLAHDGVAEIQSAISATSSGDSIFFYPYIPMLPFLFAREQASKYDVFVPWYTTPAQYHDACLSIVRRTPWVVIDRKFLDYRYWRQTYPSMPKTQPPEAIQFEKMLDRSFVPVTTKGDFEFRRRREGINSSVCDLTAAQRRTSSPPRQARPA